MTTKIDNYSFLEKELEFAKLEIANLHDDIHEWMDKCDALRAEWIEQNAFIVKLQNELRSYREREKTMGWNND